jgi:hypothetical protein
MPHVAMGRLVVYTSPDGKTNWTKLKPQDVPDWLKDPDTLGSILEGNLAHKRAEGVIEGSAEDIEPWYSVVEIDSTGQVSAPAANADTRDEPIRLPTMTYITPDARNTPAGLRSENMASPDTMEHIAADLDFAEAGVTRAQMLGNGGTEGVPQHPDLEKPKLAVVRDGPSPAEA